MPERQPRSDQNFVVRSDQQLSSVLVQDYGHEIVVYFTDDAQADAKLHPAPSSPPIKLGRVWADLDATEILAVLDRIRHQSRPTPPITDW